jgi:D-serine deaminase-like pyridoxal phosphate-dependent protein
MNPLRQPIRTGNAAPEYPRVATAEAARERYALLAKAINGHALPAAILDLDLLEMNARSILSRAGSLPIRLGSKSIRCTTVLRHVQALSPRYESGLLCYSAREAAWLANQGFDDLLVAYPTIDIVDLDSIAPHRAAGKRIVLMVDDPAQIDRIAARARALNVKYLLAIDLDCSSDFPGIYFGVRRSPVNSAEIAVSLARAIALHPIQLKLIGLMGYEGQIAGLQDQVPGQAAQNSVLQILKRSSIAELGKRRGGTVCALRAAGFDLEFVNGGGTGSLESTTRDASVSEVTVGSGLYSPSLFDHFKQFHHAPALCFALRVTRRPIDGIVTCLGGGYVASGPAGADRLPRPYLPSGMKLLRREGAGEVQTPVQLPAGQNVSIGDPLFFRHAKAGELAERFTHFLLMRNGVIEGSAPTYRGEGQCFF